VLIARDKKENNIAEYVLYIWQLEDLLRANQLDFGKVQENIVSKFEQDAETMKEISHWYENFVALMKAEKLEQSGHTQFIKNTVNDMFSFHLELLKRPEENRYRELYQTAAPDIANFQMKGKYFYENEIETIFSALYAVLLLKFKNKIISQGTQAAVGNFSNLLSMLAFKYHKNETGNSELETDE